MKEYPCHVYMPLKQINGQTITYNGTTTSGFKVGPDDTHNTLNRHHVTVSIV